MTMMEDSGRWPAPGAERRTSIRRRSYTPLWWYNRASFLWHSLFWAALIAGARVPLTLAIPLVAILTVGDFYIAWLIKRRSGP